MGADIFISVAEDSADMHAAALVSKASAALPDARFHGLTGRRLRAAGVETIFDMAAHAAMLTGIIKVIGTARKALQAVEASWDRRRPDVVVLIDSPELHLRLAKKAKARGIPVLYYVAPQTWASRAGRNKQIAHDIDHLACILPFEEAYFREQGVTASFVGHPLFETLKQERPDPQRLSDMQRGDAPLLAILPGSRAHVIDAVLPLQLKVLQHLHDNGVAFRATVSAASEERARQIGGILQGVDLPIDVATEENATLLTAADLVLVASGTATLHVAHYRKPMVVLYDAGRVLQAAHRVLERFVLTTPHLSLINILAGSRIVPEYMPFGRDTEQIAGTVGRLLGDPDWQRQMVGEIDAVVAPLEASHASERVCGLLQELLG